MSMNVVYVTMEFPSPSETFATNEVRTLTKNGISVSVHALRPQRSGWRQLALERGVADTVVTHNCVRATLRGMLLGLSRPSRLISTVLWIARANSRDARALWQSFLLLPRAFDILALIERRRPDVVHMYWGHFPTIVGYLVQSYLPSIVTSVSIVAYDLEREYGGTIDVASRADVIRTHASVNVDHIARFTGVARERVNVIYNGVDVSWLQQVSTEHAKVPRRLLAVGRLTESKGMREVLRAFVNIRARWTDATLLVVGDGVDRACLQSMSQELCIENAVEFLGHVSHQRVAEEMARAEVLLLLSRAVGERLPNVIKEGMASRCVCITTPTPGISELVEHGVTGFVVAPSDVLGVCAIIDDLFAGRVDATDLRLQAAEHVRRYFNLELAAVRYIGLWSDAIERGRTGGRR
jgi:colanic acid/amylovoran biosynthesis glycosyltransferase